MEEPFEPQNVVPGKIDAKKTELQNSNVVVRGRVMVAFPFSELYFLIAKFLSGGPLKETAKVYWLELCLNNTFLCFLEVTNFVFCYRLY